MGGEERKIEFQCPKCGNYRLVRASTLNKANFTGLCLSCCSHLKGGCHSLEHRKKIAQSLIKHTEIAGTDSQSAGYVSIHKSFRLWFGKPTYCENGPSHIAKNDRYERANLTGTYTRNINDYASLCPTCHKAYDAQKIKIRGLFKHERMVLNGITG